jgi:predicted NUDIX family NTP pyrophosphohydrolase
MPRTRRVSAGLLLFRRGPEGLQVYLVHPGGPLFANKDAGHWSIPKGEIEPGEDLLAAAVREVAEEVGLDVDPSGALPLGSIVQKGGKVVHAWAVEVDPSLQIVPRSNTFEMEWPPRSGRLESFPEVDRGGFFSVEQARERVNPAQAPLIERLAGALG